MVHKDVYGDLMQKGATKNLDPPEGVLKKLSPHFFPSKTWVYMIFYEVDAYFSW